MITTIVNVTVKSECITDFIAASRRNHLASVQELGNLRFDVCQNALDPALFVLYEAYESEAAAAAHKATAHYAQWRDTVAPMMAAPRQGVKYNVLCPEIG
jgi:(4S)-4-hydroxy-5-phosphonooxypentane-2,3-dione isomerase